METVFVVDPYSGGHHQVYLKYICKALLSQGYTVAALCPQAEALKNHLSPHLLEAQNRLHTFEFIRPKTTPHASSVIDRAANALAHWRGTAQQLHDHSIALGCKPAHVFFAWLDEAYVSPLLSRTFIDRVFPYPWSGIYFLPYHLRSKKNGLLLRRGFLSPDYVFGSKNCKSICILDEGVANVLASRIRKTKILLVPDVADDAEPDFTYGPLTQIRRQAGARKIVGLLGGLSRRKGMIPLLQAACRLRNDGLFFLFAGRLIKNTYSKHELETLNKLIESSLENCFFLLEDIPGEPQFNALVSSCDLLSVIYEDFFHSSNLLTKAAIFSVPVVGAKGYLIDERICRYKLGMTVEYGDIDAYVDVLRRFASEPEASSMDTEANLRIYKERHSEEAFQVAIMDSIRS